jgi:hypothetical protein
MYRNQIQHLFINMPAPPPHPSLLLPAFSQPPMPPNQPLPYQAFVPPPPQPQNNPQMGVQVDYNACLLKGFHQTHGRWSNQRCNHSSAAYSEPGPTLPPPQNLQIHQHVINFQHEAEHQRYLQAQQEQEQKQDTLGGYYKYNSRSKSVIAKCNCSKS